MRCCWRFYSHPYRSCTTCRLEALLFKRLCRGSRGVTERERERESPTRKEQYVPCVEAGLNVTEAGRWQLWSVSQPAYQTPPCLGLPHLFHAHVSSSSPVRTAGLTGDIVSRQQNIA